MANIFGYSIVLFVLSFFLYSGVTSASVFSKSTIWFKSRCSMILNELDCTSASCNWWDDSCHPYQQYQTVQGEYCINLDDDVIYCMTSSQNYLIIDGVVINV